MITLEDDTFIKIMERLDMTDLEDTEPELWYQLDRLWAQLTQERMWRG